MTRAALTTLLLAIALPAFAAPPPDADPGHRATQERVDVELITDVTAVAPGERFRLGLRFEMDEHWHVYWRHPGETGLPTEIGLEAPDGFEFHGLRWPAPERLTSDSGIVSYGYEDEVLIFSEVTAPADVLEGDEVQLTAHADWLVCRDNCIPGSARLTRTLPVRSDAAPGAHHEAFVEADARVPEVRDDLSVEALLSVSGVAPNDAWEMALRVAPRGGEPLQSVDLFPAPADGLTVQGITARSEGEHVPKGGALIRVEGRASGDARRAGDRLDGVLKIRAGGETRYAAITGRIPRLATGEAAVPSAHPVFAGPSEATGPEAPTAAETGPAPAAMEIGVKPDDGPALPSMGLMILFAFLGGLILNVMPCVLPVLSIKILGLVQQAEDDRARIWRHGLSYTAGILLSFALLAGFVIALKASGQLVGWGFQFQEPAFVAAMGALVFAFGLSLFGVFEVSFPGTHTLNAAAASRHGYGGSFMNGVLATILATPCTAPFLAPALGFAMVQPPMVLLGFLLTIGLGLAFPFLALAAAPKWADWMPKPGPWMNTFKKAMGFLLVATTVWLVDVLAAQVTRDALVGYLAFLTVLALAGWVYGHWGGLHRAVRTRWIAVAVAVAIAAAGGWRFVDLERPEPGSSPAVASAPVPGEIGWKSFKDTDVEALAAAGQTVFIDFTADWCVTCKVYERTVINTDSIYAAFQEGCVVPVKADYTNEDPKITEWLQRFERPGVPMYVILPAGRPDEPLLLPDVLTKSALLDGLEKAGPTHQDACT